MGVLLFFILIILSVYTVLMVILESSTRSVKKSQTDVISETPLFGLLPYRFVSRNSSDCKLPLLYS